MKIKLNTLYRVKYNWNNKHKFGIGFADELDGGNFIFGLSLPNGGVMNLGHEDAIEILEIGVAIESDGCVVKY
jgi:hypothetical protein